MISYSISDITDKNCVHLIEVGSMATIGTPMFVISLSFLTITRSDIALPSSCLGQPNGYQWLKLLDGSEYPAVHQKCHSEYMVIDLNEDPNVESYFSSHSTWHYALSGPDQMDTANWERWWLPSARSMEQFDDEYYRFVISPDCNSCDETQNTEQNAYSIFNNDTFGDRTAYYMTGTMFGCLAMHRVLKDCRWDYDSYSCNLCTTESEDLDIGYHVVSPHDAEDFQKWTSYYEFGSVYLGTTTCCECQGFEKKYWFACCDDMLQVNLIRFQDDFHFTVERQHCY